MSFRHNNTQKGRILHLNLFGHSIPHYRDLQFHLYSEQQFGHYNLPQSYTCKLYQITSQKSL